MNADDSDVMSAAIGSSKSAPDVPALLHWLHSWVQPSGAIHGFHNHSVWGSNPYRAGDFTSGHSTWASPLLAAMAASLGSVPDPRGAEMLGRLVMFQTRARQVNGEHAHIGFQVGETLKGGLIHNVVPDVMLALAAMSLPQPLGDGLRGEVASRILENLLACEKYGGPLKGGTCNQEYTRIWARLLWMDLTGDRRWDERVRTDLSDLVKHFHIACVPDAESTLCLRELNDTRWAEPAEYYGLMICPLLHAARTYEDERWLDEAHRLALHIVRSAWTDSRGSLRFHRLWWRWEADGASWHKLEEPMCISGMGFTCEGIRRLLQVRFDQELETFLVHCDRTYAHYQHPHGFFAAATGWSAEMDVVPSTAWHAHDAFYLCNRFLPSTTSWDDVYAGKRAVPAVVLGEQCYYLEKDDHWIVGDYATRDVYRIYGRKSLPEFRSDMPDWVRPASELLRACRFPSGAPTIVKDATSFTIVSPELAPSAILNMTSRKVVRLQPPRSL